MMAVTGTVARHFCQCSSSHNDSDTRLTNQTCASCSPPDDSSYRLWQSIHCELEFFEALKSYDSGKSRAAETVSLGEFCNMSMELCTFLPSSMVIYPQNTPILCLYAVRYKRAQSNTTCAWPIDWNSLPLSGYQTFVMSSREVEFAKCQYYGCSALYIYVALIITLS